MMTNTNNTAALSSLTPEADVEHPTAPYTIRRLGQTAWATVPTLAEALTERDTADRICQRGHLIIDACGELVIFA